MNRGREESLCAALSTERGPEGIEEVNGHQRIQISHFA